MLCWSSTLADLLLDLRCLAPRSALPAARYVPGVPEFTGQSIGLPTALPASGEAARASLLSPLVPLAQAGR